MSDRAPRPPNDVTTEIHISRPIADVSAYAMNPDNAPSWYTNIESVEWKTAPPLGAGSRIAFVAHFLGKRLAYTYQVAEYVPQRRLVMSTFEGPFAMETTYEFEAAGKNATVVRLCNRGTPTGWAKLAGPLISIAMRSANEKDLARLKSLLEHPAK